MPLNATGHAQAAAASLALAAMRPVRLWSSDLARAFETAEYVARATGLPIVADARLREYDVGERSGMTLEEVAERYPEKPVPGEETTERVRDRVVPALRDCFDALGHGETGVAVMHGACLRVGLMGVVGWPWQQARALVGIDNAAYCVLAHDSDYGGIRLAAYNQRACGRRSQTSSSISSANAAR